MDRDRNIQSYKSRDIWTTIRIRIRIDSESESNGANLSLAQEAPKLSCLGARERR